MERLPSTNPSVWNSSFNTNDMVRVRIDFSDRADINQPFRIIKTTTVSDFIRPENPTGKLYDLENGQSWEGKDLELVSKAQEVQIPNKAVLPPSFKEYDTEKDKIIILRVKPKSETPPPPQGDDDNPPPKDDKGDNDNKDDKGDKGDEGDNQDKGDEGDNQDKGDEGDNQDKGDEGDKDGKGKKEKDFSGEGDEEEDLESMMKKIKEAFDKGKSTQQIQSGQDLDVLAKGLSVPQDRIKETFKSKSVVRSALGNRNLFGANNKERIEEILNQIFN